MSLVSSSFDIVPLIQSDSPEFYLLNSFEPLSVEGFSQVEFNIWEYSDDPSIQSTYQTLFQSESFLTISQNLQSLIYLQSLKFITLFEENPGYMEVFLSIKDSENSREFLKKFGLLSYFVENKNSLGFTNIELFEETFFEKVQENLSRRAFYFLLNTKDLFPEQLLEEQGICKTELHSFQLPKELANLLLDHEGQFIIGLSISLEEIMLKGSFQDQETGYIHKMQLFERHETQILSVLKALSVNSQLIESLSSIVSCHAHANFLLRGDLEISLNEEITPRLLRKEVLTTLFSLPYQDSHPNCFAVASTIGLMLNSPLSIVYKIKEFFKYGHFQYIEKNRYYPIPFTPFCSSSPLLSSQIDFDDLCSSGVVHTLLSTLGLKDTALDRIEPDVKSPDTISLESLLKHLVMQNFSRPLWKDLFLLGMYTLNALYKDHNLLNLLVHSSSHTGNNEFSDSEKMQLFEYLGKGIASIDPDRADELKSSALKAWKPESFFFYRRVEGSFPCGSSIETDFPLTPQIFPPEFYSEEETRIFEKISLSLPKITSATELNFCTNYGILFLRDGLSFAAISEKEKFLEILKTRFYNAYTAKYGDPPPEPDVFDKFLLESFDNFLEIQLKKFYKRRATEISEDLKHCSLRLPFEGGQVVLKQFYYHSDLMWFSLDNSQLPLSFQILKILLDQKDHFSLGQRGHLFVLTYWNHLFFIDLQSSQLEEISLFGEISDYINAYILERSTPIHFLPLSQTQRQFLVAYIYSQNFQSEESLLSRLRTVESFISMEDLAAMELPENVKNTLNEQIDKFTNTLCIDQLADFPNILEQTLVKYREFTQEEKESFIFDITNLCENLKDQIDWTDFGIPIERLARKVKKVCKDYNIHLKIQDFSDIIRDLFSLPRILRIADANYIGKATFTTLIVAYQASQNEFVLAGLNEYTGVIHYLFDPIKDSEALITSFSLEGCETNSFLLGNRV